MSTAVFNQPVGTAYPVTREIMWDNVVQTAISGKETRIAHWTYPKYKWTLDMNILRSSSAYSATEFQYVLGFFNARSGQYDTFLYQDADDYSVTSQTIGQGNGTLTQFQLVRTFGGFIEPVLAPNVVSAVYLNGTSIPSAGLSAPNTPVLSYVSGGSLGATTYYVKTTWATGSGESLPSTEASLSVPANNVLVITAPTSTPSSVIGWYPYVSNTAMGGSGQEVKQQPSVVTAGSPWQENNAGLNTTGYGSVPTSNQTGWSYQLWPGSATAPGYLSFNGAVLSGITVTADFTYYWPVRMSQDTQSFSLNFKQKYNAKKFVFQSVKN